MTAPGPAPAYEVAEAGFENWIDRVVALTGLFAALVALLLSVGQAGSLHPVWLLAVAGTLLAAGVGLPVHAWSHRPLRVPATVYADVVALGLWTWPPAWTGTAIAGVDQPPWLWPCIGVATVVVWVAWGTVPAVGLNLVCLAALLTARLGRVGGPIGPATALQDMLAVTVLPLLVVVLFSFARRQAVELDRLVTSAHRHRADAVLRASLVDERARMDALVHDEVMTALVAGARSATDHDPAVTALARRALASLQAQSRPDPDDTPIPPASAARVLRDVAVGVNPGVRFVSDIEPLAPLLPRDVVEAMAQALREAVLNAEKHASADEVVVTVTCAEAGAEVRLRVEVADDGVGFDLEAVPGRRLGIRLSLLRRLRTVSGEASVDSAPGRGTRVTLTWCGAGAGGAVAQPDGSAVLDHPALGTLRLAPIAVLAGAGATLFTVIAAIQSLESPRPELVWASIPLLGVAVPLALHRFGRDLPRWAAALVVVLGLAVTVLNLAALPVGSWPLHGTAFLGVVCVLVVLMRAGGRGRSAWALAVLAGVLVLGASWRLPGWPLAQVGSALSPVGWLVAAEMLGYWMRRVRRQLDLAQRAADEASAEAAASFARLVVREVWVADVRETVGELLDLLADPDARIGRLDRDACLAAEGTLRDRIKAANFNAPALSAAIVRARLRGVQVTLVSTPFTSVRDRLARWACGLG